MEHEVREAIHELTEFATITARAIADHKQVLERHEENLRAEYRSVESHKTAIEELRGHLANVAQLVNQQNILMAAMQKSLLRVLNNLGLIDSEGDTSAIN
jgi:hypothetical protein